MWGWILLGSVLAFATKYVGYLLPERVLERPRVIRMTSALTIGLLASLIALNTFGSGQSISVDARLGSLIVAIIALKCKVPFLGVVVLGAATAGILRLLGIG